MPIVILTIEGDQSTSDVLDWVLRKNKPFVRINLSTAVAVKVELGANGRIVLLVDGETVPLDTISSFWYRRGALRLYQRHSSEAPSSKESQLIDYHLRAEENSLAQYISYGLDAGRSLGSAALSGLNKLIVLQKAQQHGLSVPETLVTSQRSEALNFLRQHGRLITKPLSESLDAPYEDGFAQVFTEEVDEDFLAALPATFPPSLFQQRIDRRYELRIFFLEQKFYAMAIISPNFQGRVTDIRKPGSGLVTRNVPFALPAAVERKLIGLMASLRLNTGSIDMALTTELDYVLFEVNPIGQYSATSMHCNYFLDKKIADFLLHE